MVSYIVNCGGGWDEKTEAEKQKVLIYGGDWDTL